MSYCQVAMDIHHYSSFVYNERSTTVKKKWKVLRAHAFGWTMWPVLCRKGSEHVWVDQTIKPAGLWLTLTCQRQRSKCILMYFSHACQNILKCTRKKLFWIHIENKNYMDMHLLMHTINYHYINLYVIARTIQYLISLFQMWTDLSCFT